jgi:poly-gamma-glutamate capsule biosynthesis protein CapA/YwtB (metallophosphatase superfamily)|tara:strand:+ start:2794 stop:3090 length:297 start_codon:yes stop_codon:yes gene_type:complete
MSTHFIYGVATNTGKGFFTAEDRRKFFLRGYPADVWMIGNNVDGAMWLAEKNGVEKTKAEAQALINAEIQAAQATWDAQSDEEKAMPGNIRPSDVTLP